MVALLATQIFLGAMVIWTGRNAYLTTTHVLVGALTLATTFLLTWITHRDELEGTVLDGAPSGRALPAQNPSSIGTGRGAVGSSVHA
jgi:heme A synthase